MELAGEGATSRVFSAFRIDSGARVALKRLHPRLVDNPQSLARLRRELEASSRLRHPSVVRIYDVIDWAGDPTVVMDFIDGDDLAEIVRARGHLDAMEIERIARAILGALSSAHVAGIVHRDVKPQNVRIGRDGKIFLLDFGSARLDAASHLTATGSTVGTPDYMPPESFEGPVYDPRVDLYGLGATLFEALTGRPPHEASSLAELALKRARDDAPAVRSVAPDVPPALAHLVDRCLARRPEDRFASASLALWSLDHAEVAMAYLAERSRHPPCLHCETPIAPESRACPACGSDHPFAFREGSASLVLKAVSDPTKFVAALELRFPELVADRAHVFERLAALGTDAQPIVSFIDESEANALASVLEKTGARIEVSVDEGTSGFRLYALGVACFLGAVFAAGGLLGAGVGASHLALLALPIALTLMGERLHTVARSRHGILAAASRVPVVPWIGPATAMTCLFTGAGAATISTQAAWLSELGALEPALVSVGLGGAFSLGLVPALLFASFRPRALPADSSAEPPISSKLARAFSVPAALRQKLKAPIALAVGAVVASTVPIELAAIESLVSVQSASTTELAQPAEPAFFGGESFWVHAAAADDLAAPIAPVAAGDSPTPIAPEPSAPDPTLLFAFAAIAFCLFGPTALVVARRRRIRRLARRLHAEAPLGTSIKAPLFRRARLRLSGPDRLALESAPDAFAISSRTKLVEAARQIEPAAQGAELGRIREALARLEPSSGPRPESFVGRCIKETDPDVSIRMELLAIEGNLEAEAATAWSRRLRGVKDAE